MNTEKTEPLLLAPPKPKITPPEALVEDAVVVADEAIDTRSPFAILNDWFMDKGEHWAAKFGAKVRPLQDQFDRWLEASQLWANSMVVSAQHWAQPRVKRAKEIIRPIREQLREAARLANERKFNNRPVSMHYFRAFADQLCRTVEYDNSSQAEALRQLTKEVRALRKQQERTGKSIRVINKRLEISDNEPVLEPVEAAGDVSAEPTTAKLVTPAELANLVEHALNGQPSKVQQLIRQLTLCDQNTAKATAKAMWKSKRKIINTVEVDEEEAELESA